MKKRIYETVISPQARRTSGGRVPARFINIIGLNNNLPSQLGNRKFIGEIDSIEEGTPKDKNPADQKRFKAQQPATPQHSNILAGQSDFRTIGFL